MIYLFLYFFYRYWTNPGAFVDGAVGTISVLLSAGFSYQGTEVGK